MELFLLIVIYLFIEQKDQHADRIAQRADKKKKWMDEAEVLASLVRIV